MNKSKIVYGVATAVVVGHLSQEAVHVSPVEQVTADRPNVQAPPNNYLPHGSDPQDPSGPLLEAKPAAATTSTISVPLTGEAIQSQIGDLTAFKLK